jgi:hypothetical protein
VAKQNVPSSFVSTEYLKLAVALEPMVPVISSHGNIRSPVEEAASSNLTLTFLTPSPVVRFTTRPDIVHLSIAGDSSAKDFDVEQMCRKKHITTPTTVVRLTDIVNYPPPTLGVIKGHSSYANR